MILAVDIGNTNVVLGLFNDNVLKFTERITTAQNKSVREYFISIKNALEFNDIDSELIEGVVISSVVPSITKIVKEALSELICGEIIVVNSNIITDINIQTDNPSQVGTDRIVDSVAIVNEYPLPAVIIDMGTATTISVIDENKNFIGGLIMAGVKISLDALTSKTSQLPSVSFEAPSNLIGKNTVDCIKSGIVNGTASCLDGVISRIEKNLGMKVTAVATGGLSHLIIPHCEHKIIYDENLLLKGLICIYMKNR